MRYPQSLEKLLSHLQMLGGVGRRTAERYAFDFLLDWKEHEIHDFVACLNEARRSLTQCPICGALQDGEKCLFCADTTRRRDLLCIVATPREVFSIESTREFSGLYHVLGALLSPLDGRGEELLQLDKLTNRLHSTPIKEVVLALDSTLEGDTTALYLKQQLEMLPVKVSRLAFGIPVGSCLEYVDGGTLARAFLGRSVF
jgi:recombination protein RecR